MQHASLSLLAGHRLNKRLGVKVRGSWLKKQLCLSACVEITGGRGGDGLSLALAACGIGTGLVESLL